MQIEPLPLWVNLLSVAVAFVIIYFLAVYARQRNEADHGKDGRSGETQTTSCGPRKIRIQPEAGAGARPHDSMRRCPTITQ